MNAIERKKPYSLNLLMPNEECCGGIVVASSYFDDERGIILVLNHKPPYYSIWEIVLETGVADQLSSWPNIIPAAEEYQQISACW